MDENNARILIVDDEHLTRELLSLQLREAGYQVDSAVNGRDAIARIHHQPPDLVISDILMPELDGFGLVRELRSSPELRNLPVIFYSAHFLDVEDQKLAYRLGVSHYLTRPQDLAQLAESVKAALSNNKHSDAEIEAMIASLEKEVPQIHQARTLDQLVLKLYELTLSQQNLATTEARYKNILEAAPDAVVISDDRGLISLVNGQAERLFGYHRDELIGQSVEILIPEPQVEAHVHHRAEFLASDQLFLQKHRQERFKARKKNGEVFPVEINLGALTSSGHKTVTAIIRDMREHHRAENQIRHLNRIYRVLSGCNHVLVHASDEKQLLSDYCRIIVEHGGYPLSWVCLSTEGGGLRLQEWYCRTPEAGQVGLTQDTVESCRQFPVPADFTIEQLDRLPGIGTEWLLFAEQAGCRSCLLLPLRTGEKTIGCLGILNPASDTFDTREIALLQELGMDLSYGIHAQRNQLIQREAESRLRLQQRALESSANGIVILDWLDPGHPVVYANPAYAVMTGYDLSEIVGRNPVFLCNEDTDQPGIRMLDRALAREMTATVVVQNFRKDGTRFWNEIHVAPVADENGRVTSYVAITQDVTERISYENNLEHQATHDDLTGLSNRVMLMSRLEHALEVARRSGRQVAVLFLDLDRFKVINDSLGHETGDRLLQEVAGRLLKLARSVDTLARMGGDEFVFVITELETLGPLERLCSDILNSIREPLQIGSHTLVTTVSIGCSIYSRDGDDAGVLLRHADAAMYRAKDNGGDCRCYYESAGRLEAEERLKLEVDLRSALESGQFVLHYQPQIALTSGAIVGAEALVRWQHPERGLVAPDHFIPVAEEIGVIQSIGRWVLWEACRQFRQWEAEQWQGFTMAVNVSYQQFASGTLLQEVREVLEEFSIEPEWLELELTERVMMKNTDAVLSQLQELKALGVKLSIDDFGTGFSSLSYLKRFSLDRLKVDRSFVIDLNDDDDSYVITRAISEMAHLMSFEVVAEGVETHEQMDTLRSFGCEFVQGYLFSTPKPADEFRKLMGS